MKILKIAEPGQVDFGSYGPACEGFIDKIKAVFFAGTGEEKAERLKKSDGHRLEDVSKELDRDLGRTFENPEWVKKLPEQEGHTNVKLLKSANIEGKPIVRPQALVAAGEHMLSVARKIFQQEKPHFELRRALIKKIDAIGDNPAEIDKLWLQHKNQLLINAAERYIRAGGKPQPAFGYETKNPKNQWPVRGKGEEGFNIYDSVETSGEFVTVTQANAKEFVTAIQQLLALSKECDRLGRECYVTDWEDCPASMDDMKHGDAIFFHLYSSQSVEELHNLFWVMEAEFGRFAASLYILMFDKRQ